MLARRIAITVCALCLAAPAVAGASEGTNPANGNPAAGPPSTVKAKGPYGSPPGAGPQSTTAVSVHGGGVSRRHGADGWRTAAISEAALLAAVLLGMALLLPALRRAPRMVT